MAKPAIGFGRVRTRSGWCLVPSEVSGKDVSARGSRRMKIAAGMGRETAGQGEGAGRSEPTLPKYIIYFTSESI